MSNQRSHLICNILLQQYINRHFFYKASFIAETLIWLSTPLYLWVAKFDYGLWFLRKPFSANHVPLSGLLAQCLLLAQPKRTSVRALSLFTLALFSISKDMRGRWKLWISHWYVCEWLSVFQQPTCRVSFPASSPVQIEKTNDSLQCDVFTLKKEIYTY